MTDSTGRRRARRAFGSIEVRPGGRFRARYLVGPNKWRTAPTTFATRGEADAWLNRERVRLEQEAAGSPKSVRRERPPRLREYAATWIADRSLRPSTRRTYEGYLRLHVTATALGARRLDEITPADVRAWHADLGSDHPTGRARAYAFVKAVLKTAVDDDLIPANPCRIVGAGQSRPTTEVEVLTPEQVDALAAQLDSTSALAVLLGAYGQLRIGEALALRRRDVDLERGGLDISRQATAVGTAMVVGPPKTRAGVRNVALPAFVLERLRQHLATLPAGRDRLLFPASDPSAPTKTQTMSDRVHRAAVRAGLPSTFRYHHLRHTGLTLLADAGASVAELQARAGHTTPSMALRYQHARAERDRGLADRLGELVAERREAGERP